MGVIDMVVVCGSSGGGGAAVIDVCIQNEGNYGVIRKGKDKET